MASLTKVRGTFSAREMEFDWRASELLRGTYHRSTRPALTPWFNAAPGKRPITRAANRPDRLSNSQRLETAPRGGAAQRNHNGMHYLVRLTR